MKNYNFVKLLFLFIISNIAIYGSNRHVVGAMDGCGLFSLFFQALNNISWAERNRKIPVIHWSTNCLYHQPEGYNNSNGNALNNAWEYYFEKPAGVDYVPGEQAYCGYFAPDGSGIESIASNGLSLLKYRTWANNIINKYIKIKPNIYAKAQDFFNKNIANKPTIAIHLRGTDKNRECPMIHPSSIINEANKYPGYQYFVATDEQMLLDFAKKNLKGPVITCDVIRSKDGQPIHFKQDQFKALRGEEVLIEVLLMSSCNMFMHTLSNVSIAAYFFNPKLKGVIFMPNGQPFHLN